MIEIAGQQWTVMAVPAHGPGLWVDGTVRRGACWPATAKMYISEELAGDQASRVIMHELVHAYIYSTQAITVESWSEKDVCELFAIYGWEIAAMCQLVCQNLFPEIKLRKWAEIAREVRV